MRINVRLFCRKNDQWYVEYDTGKRQSLKTKDASVARQLYRKIERAYLKGRVAHILGECTMTAGKFRDEFVKLREPVEPRSTFRANRLALDKLIGQCGEGCLLNRITAKHVDQMIAHHMSKGVKPTSINCYIRHAKAVMGKAVEWGYIPSNPLKDVAEIKAHKTLPAFLSKSDLARFLASIEDVDLRRLVTAYIATGRRRSELLGLEWRDVNLEKRRYRVRRSKSHLERVYSINSMFLAVLNAIGQGSPESHVFDRWAHPDTVSHLVKKALKDFGYGQAHLHSLRHTYASLKAEEGVTMKQLQELLGHQDIKATMIYAHLTEDHLADIGEVNIGPVDLGMNK
jgi:site-specific recombinase XerD